ncbi:ribonuclease activity regulator RraA [Sphingobium algorifonticola]|uniref:Ribonuclease activity regulator RraA n=1 Tax=Sphingobium algorifonticola TaxID=2008318 RepID=A0A437J9V5_9SPHN|nr:ribonuclease activity regulator RraA [Sphingobium algorifonticola]RVT42289.1 ribonuclease activity regulator RraA [Sphingobium algorifonticola]
MRDDPLSVPEATIETLRNAATSSLATLLLKRGLRNQYVQGVSLVGDRTKRMAGPAFTLRHIPAREDIDVVEAFRDPKHAQRVAVETVPPGHILVMDCRQDASAASGGSILFTRLEVRGCGGVVTDAGLRDYDTIATLNLPCFAAKPSAPTNLSRHHALDINVPIGCGGAPVYPGDIIVGDSDGVVVIPAHLASDIAAEVGPMEAFEQFALAEVRAGASVIGTYPPNPDTEARYVAYCAGSYTPGG